MTHPDSINFDRIAERYDATRGGEVRGEQLGADVAAQLDPSRRVLEVGVGTGVISLALRKRGFDVVGVDLSEQMLVRARARLGPRVARGDAMALPIANGSVDQVAAVWVLHCVADPAVVLGEIARCLRPGGVCAVVDGKAVFNPDDPADIAFREIEQGLGLAPRLGRAHVYADLAPGAGLRVERIVDSGPHAHEHRLAHVLHSIEKREHSYMWAVPDDVWERISAPVIERLRARPDLDAPRTGNGWQEILVLRR